MNRDDENWFDALAGKPNPDTTQSTLQEATALRAALLGADSDRHQGQKNVVNIASLQALKDRLRSEGLLPPVHKKCASRNTITMSIAASIFVCVGLGLSLQSQFNTTDYGVQVTARGGEELSAIIVTDAASAVHQLEQQLNTLSIPSQIQCELHHCSIEAYIPSEQEDAVNALIEPTNKSVGANGQLTLKFITQEK